MAAATPARSHLVREPPPIVYQCRRTESNTLDSVRLAVYRRVLALLLLPLLLLLLPVLLPPDCRQALGGNRSLVSAASRTWYQRVMCTVPHTAIPPRWGADMHTACGGDNRGSSARAPCLPCGSFQTQFVVTILFGDHC